jgi:hypothetical protein
MIVRSAWGLLDGVGEQPRRWCAEHVTGSRLGQARSSLLSLIGGEHEEKPRNREMEQGGIDE